MGLRRAYAATAVSTLGTWAVVAILWRLHAVEVDPELDDHSEFANGCLGIGLALLAIVVWSTIFLMIMRRR